jgi:hypothetical protein
MDRTSPDRGLQLGLHHFFKGQMPRWSHRTAEALALQKNVPSFFSAKGIKLREIAVSKMYVC